MCNGQVYLYHLVCPECNYRCQYQGMEIPWWLCGICSCSQPFSNFVVKVQELKEEGRNHNEDCLELAIEIN